MNFLNRFSKKSSNIKFLENLPNGSHIVPCGQTDNTKPTVALSNFANAPRMLV